MSKPTHVLAFVLASTLMLAACAGARARTASANPGAAAAAPAPCPNCDKADCKGCDGGDKAHADCGDCAGHDGKNVAFKLMTAEQLQEKMQGAARVAVFDVNGPERYAKGHVPGAKHLLREDIGASTLPADKAAMVVFYCGSSKCMASHKAARVAASLGYTNVWVMSDGIRGWEAKGLRTEM